MTTDLGFTADTCIACKATANVMRWSAGYAVGPPSWQCRCGRDNAMDQSGHMQIPHEKPDQVFC